MGVQGQEFIVLSVGKGARFFSGYISYSIFSSCDSNEYTFHIGMEVWGRGVIIIFIVSY